MYVMLMLHFGQYHINATIQNFHKNCMRVGEKQCIVILTVSLQARSGLKVTDAQTMLKTHKNITDLFGITDTSAPLPERPLDTSAPSQIGP